MGDSYEYSDSKKAILFSLIITTAFLFHFYLALGIYLRLYLESGRICAGDYLMDVDAGPNPYLEFKGVFIMIVVIFYFGILLVVGMFLALVILVKYCSDNL